MDSIYFTLYVVGYGTALTINLLVWYKLQQLWES